MRSLQHTELSIGATASLWEAYLTPRLQALYQQREALQLEAGGIKALFGKTTA